MPEWLREAAMTETPISAGTMALRLVLAVFLGLPIGVIYRYTHGRRARDARTLFATLVLLTVLLAMVTMVIGESVARAFGLVGALSIVRFRTVVDDTRDTAFVIFAVVVGMAVGTGLSLVAMLGIPVVGVAAWAMSRVRDPGSRVGPGDNSGSFSGSAAHGPGRLVVRLGVGHAPGAVGAVLTRRGGKWRLMGVSTTRQGAAVDLTYSIGVGGAAPGADATSLVAELNGLPGVQSVDYRAEGWTE